MSNEVIADETDQVIISEKPNLATTKKQLRKKTVKTIKQSIKSNEQISVKDRPEADL